jgi:hypothetical protein
MRNDHAFNLLDGRYPTPQEIERIRGAAHRMRSDAVHAALKRAVDWVRWLFSTDSVKVTVQARRVTC